MPIDPPYVGRVAGPMTRTVDDAALMMSVLSKPDRRDGMSLPAHDINWKALEKSPRKLRIGLMLDAGAGQALEKPVRDVVVKAAKAFEAAGAVVTEVDGILTREMLDGVDNFFRARMWGDLSKLPEKERAKALPYILQWAERGAKLSGVDVINGFNQTMAIRAAAAKLFCELDYLISPVSPVVNFPAEFASPLNDPAKPFEHIGYTMPWNMAENPAVSVNGGYDKNGFPIGVQIVGRRFDDIGVLGMAKAFEGLRGPQQPVAIAAEEIASRHKSSSWPGLTAAMRTRIDTHQPTWTMDAGSRFARIDDASQCYEQNKIQEGNTHGVRDDQIRGRRKHPHHHAEPARKAQRLHRADAAGNDRRLRRRRQRTTISAPSSSPAKAAPSAPAPTSPPAPTPLTATRGAGR